jgi:hypothetical protein
MKKIFFSLLCGHFLKAYEHKKMFEQDSNLKECWIAFVSIRINVYLIPMLLLSHGFHTLKVHISTV